jgi:flagellar hook protein FlgE
MTGFPDFQSSVLGMQSHSRALGVISGNIANATTDAYKVTDIGFATLLGGIVGDTPASGVTGRQGDMAGVRPLLLPRISGQGEIASTGRSHDVAINGPGFFVLHTGASGAHATVYGRAGHFAVATGAEISVSGPDGKPAAANEGWLVDGNGYQLQGWPVRADGSVNMDALGGMRVDADAFPAFSQATMAAALSLNLPANNAVGDRESFAFSVFDSAGDSYDLTLGFTKTAPNAWDLDLSGAAGDAVTLSPPDPVTFDTSGQAVGPLTYAVTVGEADGESATFSLDLSGLTQLGGPMLLYDFSQDGFGAGRLQSFGFDAAGNVVGTFSNGISKPLYRLALADFANADGLDTLPGNVYAASAASGAAVLGSAGESGLGAIAPQAIERSTVDLAQEFSRMILTQKAYNSAASAFRTIDEMSQTARDLR